MKPVMELPILRAIQMDVLRGMMVGLVIELAKFMVLWPRRVGGAALAS